MTRDLSTLLIGTVIDGSLYAIIGVGFVILFRSTGVINFAQGAFMALSGYLYLVAVNAGLPWAPALAAAIVMSGLIGALAYVLLFRRLVGAELFPLVIATLGLSTVLTVVMMLIWGPEIRSLPSPFQMRPLFFIGGMPVTGLDVFVVVLGVVAIGAVTWMVQGTKVGTRMRAVANSSLLSGLMRIDVHRVSALAWGLSAGLTAAAGVAYALRTTIDPVTAQGFGLVAFAAVLIGGLDSLRGAITGGFILAFVQTAAVLILGGSWSEVTAYVALLAILFTRPQGIFGSPSVVRL
ncbi:branched-chain amino acid ABC transporter permease [Dactylosporangium sp. AC04546]|uniref:branched-chain amino acid ABC transporter permease n=1 Tax=Dactylosporangium sp. AC04546 TaxID=2862460 RepID=UPI001EDEBF32|nr:branched-chain amino acid ABC transporter permease [Dactylosporangium sp. AC04546]WVK80906.1 branched-chain amino acid ABC transporter permease [Dactylosporangium sp. AC04546]